MSLDVLICVGPGDGRDIKQLVNNIKENIVDLNKIYLIMPQRVLEVYMVFDQIVINIDESIFPFNKKYIDDLFLCPERSGWYLQQLLKIYAPIVIKELLDNYIIIDADLRFYQPVSFFEENKILFNTSMENWPPYLVHLNKLCSRIKINQKYSGVTHLMPMKRYIVERLIKIVEEEHKEVFWKVFLNLVDPKYYSHSGASEYQILFHFTQTFFPNECRIRQIRFLDSGDKFTFNTSVVYEARQIK